MGYSEVIGLVFNLSIFIVSVFILIQIISFYAFFLKDKNSKQSFENWPKVSILLAARNEAFTIERCLLALSDIEYPKDKLQILIGNDSSEDDTQNLVEKFIKTQPHFSLLQIIPGIGKTQGKANVLAQLANHANGDFYFITDCDVAVSPLWIKSLLTYFTTEVGIVSGTTTCDDGNTMANLQSIDWLHFMGYIKSFANMDIGCTSVGNNMAVRATAYWQTGGYENIDFSITEDYKLFKEVTQRGWKWRNSINANTLGLATYVSSLAELMHQRKRWLMGAQELPVIWKVLLFIYGLFYPAILILGMFNFKLALAIWFIKFILQSIFISFLFRQQKHRLTLKKLNLILYEIYLFVMVWLTLFFYLLPIKSVWKGRKYSKHGLS